MVELPAHNRTVAGSRPARPIILRLPDVRRAFRIKGGSGMSDKEFREAIMTMLLDPEVELKADNQSEMNDLVISHLRKQIRKYRKFWDLLFKMKS